MSAYEGWTVSELAEECRSRELSIQGKKAELVARLEQDDQPAEGTAAEPTPVKKMRVRPAAESDRPRAGGHVLTERGWVVAPRDEE